MPELLLCGMRHALHLYEMQWRQWDVLGLQNALHWPTDGQELPYSL